MKTKRNGEYAAMGIIILNEIQAILEAEHVHDDGGAAFMAKRAEILARHDPIERQLIFQAIYRMTNMIQGAIG